MECGRIGAVGRPGVGLSEALGLLSVCSWNSAVRPPYCDAAPDSRVRGHGKKAEVLPLPAPAVPSPQLTQQCL